MPRCGTDSAEWDHGPVLTVPPVILGHEFAGRVVAVGPGVAGIRVGDPSRQAQASPARSANGAGRDAPTCAARTTRWGSRSTVA